MNFRLLSAAEADLAEAARWYESQASGLGLRSLDEFEATMARVIQFPDAWTSVSAHHRRCLFRRFPFAVIYTVTDSHIRASAVADLRRDPAHIADRTKES